MNRLLLITGDMAAGKSTFSHMLGERYDLPVFNKDTLKEVMSNTLPFTDREDNLRLSHAAVDLLLFLFEQLAPCTPPSFWRPTSTTGRWMPSALWRRKRATS